MDRGMNWQDWPRIPIYGSEETFTPRRIWCIGRNYVEHAREMGESGSKPPLIFAKSPAGLVVGAGSNVVEVPYPVQTQEFHHEVELVVAIGNNGGVIGTAVGLDMTRRDLQASMKARRGPWSIAKDFDGAAPIGPIVSHWARLGGVNSTRWASPPRSRETRRRRRSSLRWPGR